MYLDDWIGSSVTASTDAGEFDPRHLLRFFSIEILETSNVLLEHAKRYRAEEKISPKLFHIYNIDPGVKLKTRSKGQTRV
jgi:hypothetical protein